jgi:hypothetical protein
MAHFRELLARQDLIIIPEWVTSVPQFVLLAVTDVAPDLAAGVAAELGINILPPAES